jgi:hypothetical protein
VIPGNTNWNAAADAAEQAPVYYLAVNGISGEHYATAPVRSAAVTKVLILGTPEGDTTSTDLITGRTTAGRIRVALYDVAGKATDLVGVGRSGAPVSTWRNRLCTLYAGYRSLVEADYIAIWTGRVAGIAMLPGGTGYELDLEDIAASLDGPIMVNATEAKPTIVRGNVVNVFASILRGAFSTSDPDFPLTFVSTDSGSSAAPTGLGIAAAQLDVAGMKAERDLWHPTDIVEVEFRAQEDGKRYLEEQFLRAFQARIRISGLGLLGFSFLAPGLPGSATPAAIDPATIVEIIAWEHVLSEHLNKFRIRGDWDPDAGTFADLYAADDPEDTADRAATGETIEYLLESKWIRSTDDGVEIAAELAGRLRQVYLPAPVRLRIGLSFRARRLEAGDVVVVTHPRIPDLRTGTLGIVSRAMIVESLAVDFRRGLLIADLLDANLRRYGVIAPSSVTGDYSTADTAARNTFFFVCNSSNQMADGSDGYRLI